MPEVSLGITSPNFVITFNGKCLDRNVSTAVENACDLEFIRRLALRPTQGLMIRLKNSLLLNPEMIGRQSYPRRYIEGKTKTHTRAMYTDKDYLKGSIYLYAKQESWEDDTTKFKATVKKASKIYKFLRCPCCSSLSILCPAISECNHSAIQFADHADKHSGMYGNSRHYLFYCNQESVSTVRSTMTQLLEDELTTLFRIASRWGNLGFSNLLHRSITAMIELDRSPFHNAHLRQPCYSKSDPATYACISSEDWIALTEIQAEKMSFAAKKAFLRWPLVHQLGFIPANAYTQLELEDGEYSPCDLLPMGIIPLRLQNIIESFAIELGNRHQQESKKDFLNQWQKVRATSLS
jgi:hypothetical protein